MTSLTSSDSINMDSLALFLHRLVLNSRDKSFTAFSAETAIMQFAFLEICLAFVTSIVDLCVDSIFSCPLAKIISHIFNIASPGETCLQ